jgi:formate dehydrogenase gamma subunit
MRVRKQSWFWIPGLFLLPSLLAFPSSRSSAHRKAPHPQKQDEPCLACHGTPGMKSDKGKDLSINPEKHASSAHAILACRDCHTSIKDYPHPAKIAKVECATCHEEQVKNIAAGAHSLLGADACASCHGSPHELRSSETLMPAKCAACHADEVKEFASSVHGHAAANGDPDAPKCVSCHGAIHQIKTADQPDTPTARKTLADTCAKCHSDAGFVSRHQIPLAHPVESYKQSVHGRAVAAGSETAADCSSCHGKHAIFAAPDARSSVNHWKVSATCAGCHAAVAKIYEESVHGVAVKAGVKDAPACVDCHGEHLILDPKNPASPVNPANVSAQTCGRCHASERIAELYGLPTDRVPSFADSYHGLALQGGKLTVANCASCHGVHNIFKSSDPRSTVNAANLASTCGACHSGAKQSRYAIGPVHVRITSGPNHPVVRWIRWAYMILIPFSLGFMLLHNLLDLLRKTIRRKPRRESGETILRMNLWFRVAHWGVMASFPTLVVTGFALKFPESWWAKPMLMWESNAGVRGGLHRVAAIVLIAATAFHFFHLAVKKRDRPFLRSMIPRLRDVRDMLNVFRFNLGLTKQAPQFEKFNYAEKLEYWAFLWGLMVMALSGFVLWFDNFVLRHFPKWITDAATAVHWYEALLATFSILIWHFYMVIFDPVVYPMDTAWLNGKVSADHYKHSRPAYYREFERQGLVETHTHENLNETDSTEK